MASEDRYSCVDDLDGCEDEEMKRNTVEPKDGDSHLHR